MSLNYEVQGRGDSIILIHGLFGSLGNLNCLARYLSKLYQVISIDLANHGESKHCDECTHSSMALDVVALLDELKLVEVSVIGHSMGGKVAMELSSICPDRIKSLVVIDIAPVAYDNRHTHIFRALSLIDLRQLKSRQDAEVVLFQAGIDAQTSSFLLKNLVCVDGGYKWRCNFSSIEKSYADLLDGPKSKAQFLGPVIFVKGGLSDYILPEHEPVIKRLYPKAVIEVMDGVGHWVHAEKPAAFNKLIYSFFNQNYSSRGC